jgi:hypothetical protein
MDVGFEMALFFNDKIKDSHASLIEESVLVDEKKEEEKESTALFAQDSFAFFGLAAGYVVSLLLVMVMDGTTVRVRYGRFRIFIAAASMSTI